jgi:hypothetical protein
MCTDWQVHGRIHTASKFRSNKAPTSQPIIDPKDRGNHAVHKASTVTTSLSRGGGSLGLEVGTHVRQQNRVKGGVFYMEQAARKWVKGGAFF